MTANKHTPGPWFVHKGSRWSHVKAENGDYIMEASRRSVARHHADARLIAAAPELLEALIRAQDFIDTMRQELHQRRVADWYPEGAHNAAEQMSEDMRLLGNTCADFDVSSAIAKATGASA